MINPLPSRRTFLKAAGAAAALPLLRHSVARAASPNGRLQHAGIGVGGMMGWTTLSSIAAHPKVDVVAICDVDENNLNAAAAHYPKARKYSDWRAMLAAEEKAIDSVSVAVPDHMHAAIALSAMHIGKNVYCQKPMAHDVAEVRRMTLTAAKTGLVTQLGNQHASGTGDRMAVQLIRDGVIGKVKEVYMWSNRKGVEQYRLEGPRPANSDPIPATLNWDLWLGTAPERPYLNNVYHPIKWRTWQDFGTGWGGDIGCHIGSAVFHALGLKTPTSVQAEVEPSWVASPARRKDMWPRSQHIRWEFPGTDMTADKTLTAHWLDGEIWPSAEVHALFENAEWPQECAIFIGEKGNLMLPHTQHPQLFPKAQYADFKFPKLSSIDHYQSFAQAAIDGTPSTPISNFPAVAGSLSEMVILGTVAARCPGEALQWDSPNLKVTNYDPANAFLQRTYRAGWEVKEA